MKIEDYCRNFEQQLSSLEDAEARIECAAQFLHKAFKVQAHEVAIFSFDPQQELFYFCWPTKLRTSGFVPLSTSDSLLARTGREKKALINNYFARTSHASVFECEKKALINNYFARTSHASVFECVKLDDDPASALHPIQKIMSVPLFADKQLKGVIQVSRKGENLSAAGRDFTPSELQALSAIGQVLVKFL